MSSEDQAAKDHPLRLRTTASWVADKDVKVWDMIAELVDVCTIPAPKNPFAIDLAYFRK